MSGTGSRASPSLGSPMLTPLIPARAKTGIKCLLHAKPCQHCCPGWKYFQWDHLAGTGCATSPYSTKPCAHSSTVMMQDWAQDTRGQRGQSRECRRCTVYNTSSVCVYGAQQAGWEPGLSLLN